MNLSQRTKTAAYLDALFHEFTLEEMSMMTCIDQEMPGDDLYDILMDIVGDDTIINHRLLLARILYMEEGEWNGYADISQNDSEHTTGRYGGI